MLSGYIRENVKSHKLRKINYLVFVKHINFTFRKLDGIIIWNKEVKSNFLPGRKGNYLSLDSFLYRSSHYIISA